MIVGAGLAGLIAAHVFPRRRMVEAAAAPRDSHKAVLRFRSDAVSRLTGIDFRAVTVRKAIHDGVTEVAPTIAAANQYSEKCLGRIVPDRSIWNLEPTTRYIAPEDLYDQLVEAVGSRIEWGRAVDFRDLPSGTITTAPLDVVCRALSIEPGVTFERAAITVRRFRIDRCDAFQTVYFPCHDTSMYRASITGDLLIVEFVGEPRGEWLPQVGRAFGLPISAFEPLGEARQRYGKIAPVDAAARKALVARLTTDHGLFSLGRFATWRNLLLDDVVDDAAVIKRLLRSQDYDRRILAS